MSEIRNIPPDCGVVNVQEEIVVIDIHRQLEPLDKLVVTDQVMEESPGQIPAKKTLKCLSAIKLYMNKPWGSFSTVSRSCVLMCLT